MPISQTHQRRVGGDGSSKVSCAHDAPAVTRDQSKGRQALPVQSGAEGGGKNAKGGGGRDMEVYDCACLCVIFVRRDYLVSMPFL